MKYLFIFTLGFPGGSEGKESAYNTGDLGLISGSRRSPGEGNGSPLQYSCLENPMDRVVEWATAHGVTKSHTRLMTDTFTLNILCFSFLSCKVSAVKSVDIFMEVFLYATLYFPIFNL